MFVTLACISTLIGALVVYLVNKNQRLLNKPLAGNSILSGYLCLLMAFIFWYQFLTPAAAVFMWLMTSALFFITIPLLTLLKQSNH